MVLGRKHTEYTLDLITTIVPHTVEIDRVLINLFPILKYGGKPIPRAYQKKYAVGNMSDLICNAPEIFKGFSNEPELIKEWLRSDFFILSNRGKYNEKVAAPVPLHLNAYKLRSGNETKDYGLATQIFSMLYYGSKSTFEDLRDFLYEGVTVENDKFDEKREVDIESLLLLRLLNIFPQDAPDLKPQKDNLKIPVCLGQAMILCDDISRLLSFKAKIPRLVLIRHLRNIIALNLGIYVNRVALLVTDMVENGGSPDSCNNCPGYNGDLQKVSRCPFHPSFITDMGDDHQSHMASLARKQYEDHLIAYSRYIRAHIFLRKLYEFSETLYNKRVIGSMPNTLEQLLSIKKGLSGGPEFSAFSYSRAEELFQEAQALGKSLETVYQSKVDDFDKYIAMIYELRLGYHQRTFERLMDSLFQKNTENGFLKSGFGSINKRRFSLGSGLLETLVEISTLHQEPNGEYHPRLIRIDEFIKTLQDRYGIFIQSLPDGKDATIFDLEALRQNVMNMKGRLRDIGYYQDLSDAYISQTIRSRYMELKGVQ